MMQTNTPDRLRGRVMSVYTLIFFGSMPLGSLFAGAVAQKIGPPFMVVIGSGVLLLFAVGAWFFLPQIRRQE
jgi:fucose permease